MGPWASENCKIWMYLTQSALQGTLLPPDLCDVAAINLYDRNDECSRTVRALFADDTSALLNLYYGDCPTRFYNFASVCRELLGSDRDVVSTYVCIYIAKVLGPSLCFQ